MNKPSKVYLIGFLALAASLLSMQIIKTNECLQNIEVININGNSSDFDINVVTFKGIEKLYFNSNKKVSSACIYDFQGKKIRREIPINNYISTRNLTKKKYLLSITIDNKIALKTLYLK
jgi:hypothetical protein